MSSIKSRPTYRKLALDPEGARHLLLVDRAEIPPEAFADGPGLAGPVETWLMAGTSRAIPGPLEPDAPAPMQRAFRSRPHMLERLAHRLGAETMGLRLYAVGTEDFVWDVQRAGIEAGLSAPEIHLTHVGSLRRRVICVHCHTVTEGVTTSIVPCPGCGAHLFVRDHFSRRLGGFQGVQVDAEAPGAIPPAEQAFP